MVAPMTPKNYRSKIPRGSPSWSSPSPNSVSRYSKGKRGSAATSPNNFASSKCFEPPTPEALPRPPLNWVTIQKDSEKDSSMMNTIVFTPEEFFSQTAKVAAVAVVAAPAATSTQA